MHVTQSHTTLVQLGQVLRVENTTCADAGAGSKTRCKAHLVNEEEPRRCDGIMPGRPRLRTFPHMPKLLVAAALARASSFFAAYDQERKARLWNAFLEARLPVTAVSALRNTSILVA